MKSEMKMPRDREVKLLENSRELKSELCFPFTHFENEKWNENAVESRSRRKSEMKMPQDREVKRQKNSREFSRNETLAGYCLPGSVTKLFNLDPSPSSNILKEWEGKLSNHSLTNLSPLAPHPPPPLHLLDPKKFHNFFNAPLGPYCNGFDRP